MPKTKIDNSNNVIYKIQHIEKPELIFIGNTTNFLKCKSKHKSNSRAGGNISILYANIRENGGWEMFNMIQMKEFPCKNTREVEAELDRLRRDLKSSLNRSSVCNYDVEANTKARNAMKIRRDNYVSRPLFNFSDE